MSNQLTHGVIDHPESTRPTDYLYRLSVKGFVRNEKGEVLVVKESGRSYWDLPGGGMDHGEDLTTAITREMQEEVNLTGEFTHRIISVDQPAYSAQHNFWQVRLIFEIIPHSMIFSAGVDSDEIAFIHPKEFEHSASEAERRIFTYASLV